MDPRLAPVPFVAAFANALRPIAGVVGLYAGGSLATGDYQPGRSDLDLVAVIAAPLGRAERGQLRRLHRSLSNTYASAAALHCVYMPRDDMLDVAARHLTWAHNRLYRRAFNGVGRAEVLAAGVVVMGPPPALVLPPVGADGLRAAVLGEVTGYWPGALRRPWVWLDDAHVDLGLLTLARAEATLSEGRLITKREALTRLDRLGVGPRLADEIARRRGGRPTVLGRADRVRRARTVRRLVAAGISTLSESAPGPRA